MPIVSFLKCLTCKASLSFRGKPLSIYFSLVDNLSHLALTPKRAYLHPLHAITPRGVSLLVSGSYFLIMHGYLLFKVGHTPIGNFHIVSVDNFV